MRIALIGAVESSAVALRAITDAPGVRLAAVVTVPPELAARHSDYVDLGPCSARAGAELLQSGDGNDNATVDALTVLKLDYVFVVGWSRLVGRALRATAGRGALGYHPAPLPRLRGRAAIPWTILLDERISAGTLFWMDDAADTGAILHQCFFHIPPAETAAGLYGRHMRALDRLMREAMMLLARPDPPRLPQDESCATWAAQRTADDGRIDWCQPVAAIERLVRAVGRPYPGAFTVERGGQRLVIWHCLRWPGGDAGQIAALTGQVTAVCGRSFAVRCGDGADLWINDWERPARLEGGPPRLHARLGIPE